MKKTIYTMTALAAVILAAAGCAKQEAGTQGSASLMSIEPEVEGTKATLINNATGLQGQGFGVSIYNGTTAYKGPVEMEYKNGAWAPKNGTMDWKWPSNTVYTFYAWSPADLAVGSVTSTGVPAFTYTGIADQKDIMLGCYTGTGTPGENNTCAAPVKFSHALASIQFKTGTMTGLGNITKIELEGVITSGTCTPTMSGSSTTFAWSALGTTTTTLSQTDLSVASATSGTAIGKSESDSYFLVLPQSAALTVKLTDSNAKTVTATIATPSLSVGHTAVYTINYDGQNVSLTVSIENWTPGQSADVAIGGGIDYPEGALPGVFTINSSGDKVFFSNGNLQFRATADGTGTDLSHETADGTKQGLWRFAEHQWDIIGTSACPSYSQTYTGWIDLFTFGASGYDEKEPWGFNGVNVKSVYIQKTNCDWGWYNSISNGGDVPHLWHNISMGELAYIIDTRPKATVNGAQTNVGGLKINGRPGIVIYPDGFVYPEALNVYPADISSYFDGCGFSGINSSDFTVFTEAQFTELENLGVLFLPAAGCWSNGINYTDDSYGVYNVDYLPGTKALTPLCFQFGFESIYYPSLPLTASVRLVCDAPSE